MSVWYSTDPMELDYPWCNTYGYCLGNPISLMDEFGNRPTSRIKYSGNGVFSINIMNLNRVSRTMFNRMNNDPQYWKSGEIGLNTNVFIMKMGYSSYTATPDYSPVGIDESNSYVNISNPIAKRTGLPDRRYKIRSLNTIRPDTKTKAMTYSMLAVDVMVEISDKYIQYSIFNDLSAIESQVKSLSSAYNAVNKYAKSGKLDRQYIEDVNQLGNLVNYVFQGISTNNKIKEIGNQILKENGRYDKEKKIYKTYIEE